MFNFCSTDTIIPSLTFTKAELVYAMTFLMADIPPSDHSTRIEMVELRHYLNQIKDKVALAAVDGTLRGGMAASAAEGVEVSPQDEKTAPVPSMSELRTQFPTLTDEEFNEVVTKAQKERMQEEKRKRAMLPDNPPPSFIAKENTTTLEVSKSKKNSQRFAQLLGG